MRNNGRVREAWGCYRKSHYQFHKSYSFGNILRLEQLVRFLCSVNTIVGESCLTHLEAILDRAIFNWYLNYVQALTVQMHALQLDQLFEQILFLFDCLVYPPIKQHKFPHEI